MSPYALGHLPARERELLLLIERVGRVVTRIKELGDGDLEFIQWPFPSMHDDMQDAAGPAATPDDEILTCLHALEGRGLIRCSTTVCNASTTEYMCEWLLADVA